MSLRCHLDTGARHCPRCQTTKPRSEFGTRARRGTRVPQPYCLPCMVDYHREWRATDTGGAKFNERERASKQRYPERGRARGLLRQAVASGRVVRGGCYAAGSDCAGVIEAHHDDYSKPLAVVWTCRAHHRALDRARQLREAA